MKVFHKISSWMEERELIHTSVGFVPTMGGLHAGHLKLVEQSQKYNNYTVVSLFTNPTQFNNQADLVNYPSHLEEDLELLKEMDVDAVLIPSFEEIYPDNYTFKITENEVSTVLEGSHRPGHFDGMLTVVTKLLNITRAHKAYFGEKDFQQLKLVKGLVKALFIPTEIVGVETLREEDGLAMSTRNKKLSHKERSQATLFNFLLSSELSDEEVAGKLKNAGFEVDYIDTKWNRRLGAVHIGETRLIDNVPS